MHLVNPLRQKKLRCQFSGGGDLLIETDRHSCVVVQNKIEGGGMSPIDPGTAVQYLGVEMKKGDCNLEDLHWQLFANMMAAAVSHFTDTLKNYTEKDIIDLKQITGYGIPYTGSGVVGFYKLTIEFGKNTTFSYKVPMEMRSREISAALVDHFYDIYFTKLHKLTQST